MNTIKSKNIILVDDALLYAETIKELEQIDADLQMLEAAAKENELADISLYVGFECHCRYSTEYAYLDNVAAKAVEAIIKVLKDRQLHLQQIKNEFVKKANKQLEGK